jgi:hypothetical protein
VEGCGFEVLVIRRSGLAGCARGANGWPSGTGRRLLRGLTAGAAAAAAAVSAGRWVLGPSIELYARRRAECPR